MLFDNGLTLKNGEEVIHGFSLTHLNYLCQLVEDGFNGNNIVITSSPDRISVKYNVVSYYDLGEDIKVKQHIKSKLYNVIKVFMVFANKPRHARFHLIMENIDGELKVRYELESF